MSARGEAVKALLQRSVPVPSVREIHVDATKLGRAIEALAGSRKGGDSRG